MRTFGISVALLMTAMIMAGCGGRDKSARVVADEYVNLMKAGKFDQAALLWDYDTEARAQNPDWDSAPPGQRHLMIGKLAQERARALKMWASHFTIQTKVIECSESGDQATAVLEGGRVGRVDLVKVGEVWRVSGMQ